MIQEIKISHHEYVSSRPFEEVIAAFESVVGTVEDTGFGPMASAANNISDFEDRVPAKIGSSGFARFLISVSPPIPGLTTRLPSELLGIVNIRDRREAIPCVATAIPGSARKSS